MNTRALTLVVYNDYVSMGKDAKGDAANECGNDKGATCPSIVVHSDA